MKTRKGRLFGIGTGPGDPELVTRKAWRIVSEARVIAYPAPDSGDSFSRQIMADAIHPDAIEIPIVIPMVSGRAPAQAIYDAAAETLLEHLHAGHDVVVLCEGDPLFYGSFMYLLARLRDEVEVEMVAGVSSLVASASAALRPLAARLDVLTVLAAPLGNDRLRNAMIASESLVIIKLGRHLDRLRQLISDLGLMDQAVYISHASLPHQQVMPLHDAPTDAPYFSMILIYKGTDPWIA
ncbi:MAG: precorrin-2 C(20)-methyltransferase [Candidatus Puniceispirillales bacterium]